MTPFPFVVGCGRSGTTMLRAMLDSHPDVAVPPESYFVAPALRRRRRYEVPSFRLEALLDELVLPAGSFAEWQLDPAAVRHELAAAPPVDVPDTIRRLYSAYARTRGKSRYADKTPFHVLQIERLAAAFPEARFVHLVRDGRDVVPSLLEMPFGPDRFAPAALYWRHHVSAGRRAGEALGERYLEVRYEDLVADPEAVLRPVCGFLDLPWDAGMLAYHERAGEVLRGLRRDAHLRGIARPPTQVRDWRAGLGRAELELFDALAGDLLAQLGYEPSGVEAGPGARARAAVTRADVKVRALLLRARFETSLRVRQLRQRLPT